jgi:hypothetical protein
MLTAFFMPCCKNIRVLAMIRGSEMSMKECRRNSSCLSHLYNISLN